MIKKRTDVLKNKGFVLKVMTLSNLHINFSKLGFLVFSRFSKDKLG